MAPCIKLTFLLMVTLVCVNSLPITQEDRSGDAAADVNGEEVAPEKNEMDLSGYGYKDSESDESGEELLASDEEEGYGEIGYLIISRAYARKNEISKLVILLKIIDDGLKLKSGVDQISSGIDLKKEGFQEIFNKETFKSGLEKSIEGDQLVLKGMRQSGKALFTLGLDGFFAVALNTIGNKK